MAGRPSKSHALDVWMNGERVGIWSVSPRGGHAFAYSGEWLANPRRRPISLSLPLTHETNPFRGEVVEAWFDNLLPDSHDIRTRIARRYGVSPTQAFGAVGQDCVGAVQLLPEGDVPTALHQVDGDTLTDAEVEQALLHTVGPRFGRGDDVEFRISLAGAQEKTAFLRHEGRWKRPRHTTPTTHIFKLPMGQSSHLDLSTSVENEWLCSRVLNAFGLPVAHCWMESFGPHKVLVVERFDRHRFPDWWARLPQEDFCQVLGIPPQHKYESHGGPGIDAILDKLRGSQEAEADRQRFLMTQLIFWLLGAPDGHAKNFSVFLEPEGRFRLTPLYDVMSAWPVTGSGKPNLFNSQKLRPAMGVWGKNKHDLIDQHPATALERDG